MWKRCGLLFLLLLAGLSFSSWAFSEEQPKAYILTAEEMSRLEIIFNMLATENKALQSEVKGLKMDLVEVKDSLMKAETSLREYAADMNKALSTARTKAVVYTILGVAAGGIVGYIVGSF